MGSSPCRQSPEVVSSSLEQAPVRHKSGTNGTRRAQIFARERLFDRHPGLSRQLRFHHQIEAKTLGAEIADANLHKCDDALRFGSLNISNFNNEEVKRLADNLSSRCQTIVLDAPDPASLKNSIGQYLSRYHITQDIDDRLLRSVQRSAWWRRRIYRHRRIALASVRRRIGMTNLRHSYVDSYTLEEFRRIEIKKREYLEQTVLQSETGETKTLAEFHDASVSNPCIRRIELINRLNGVTRWANENGDMGFMVTLTTPSKMHRYRQRGTTLNPNFDGSDPRSVQKYLCDLWRRCRTHLDQQGIEFYGIRVVEPHADGTPHWHMFLFTPPSCALALKKTLSAFALEVDGKEPGAKKHRITFTDEDKAKGLLIAYAVKYISKNIDGQGLEEDEHGNPIDSYVERATAWARTFGIRQFQFIGEPRIGIWRDLRKLQEPLIGQPILEPIRQAARDGDYFTYLKLMGGMGHRITRPVKRLPSNLDKKTGEILTGTEVVLSSFLSCDNVLTIVRSSQWSVKQTSQFPSLLEHRSLHGVERTIPVSEAKAEALGLFSITVRSNETTNAIKKPKERPPP